MSNDIVLQRIETIEQLYRTCRDIFVVTKDKLEHHYDKRTGDHLSERHILGKFHRLEQRLIQVFMSFSFSSMFSFVYSIF
jgi:hypothetical protein